MKNIHSLLAKHYKGSEYPERYDYNVVELKKEILDIFEKASGISFESLEEILKVKVQADLELQVCCMGQNRITVNSKNRGFYGFTVSKRYDTVCFNTRICPALLDIYQGATPEEQAKLEAWVKLDEDWFKYKRK